MPMNVNRWLKYAKAKLDDTLASGNEELDQLEARQKAERADRPWLASDADAPTFDEARARVAWQADRAEQAKDAGPPGSDPGEQATVGDPTSSSDAATTGAPDAPAAPSITGPSRASDNAGSSLPIDPQTDEEAAERSSAQIVLDQRAEESAARLAQIRAELGVDQPAPPPV
jgi:hypothetical protein